MEEKKRCSGWYHNRKKGTEYCGKRGLCPLFIGDGDMTREVMLRPKMEFKYVADFRDCVEYKRKARI